MKTASHPLVIFASIAIACLFVVVWLDKFQVTARDLELLLKVFDWTYLVPIAFLLAGHVALSSWRWTLIELGLSGQKPVFRGAMITGLFALGFGMFLPSPIVNVICRSLSNRVAGASAIRGAVSGGIDQLSDFFTVALVAVPAVAALLVGLPKIYFIGAPLALLAGFVLVFFAPTWLVWAGSTFGQPQLRQLPQLERGLLFQIYAISILRVINLNLITLAIYAATGAATISAVLVSVPLVTLAIAAAMLPGGLGVTEWSFSAVFSTFGVPASEIVIFVLANRIVLSAISLALLILAFLAAALIFSRKGAKSNAET